MVVASNHMQNDIENHIGLIDNTCFQLRGDLITQVKEISSSLSSLDEVQIVSGALGSSTTISDEVTQRALVGIL